MSKRTNLINKIEKHLENIENNYGDTDEAWKKAHTYLTNHNLDGVNEALMACGVTPAQEALDWFQNYYVDDENEGKVMAEKIDNETDQISDDSLYMSNPDYNYGYDYTPDTIEEASSGDIEQAFSDTYDMLGTAKKDSEYSLTDII